MSKKGNHIDELLQAGFGSLIIPDEPSALYDPVRYIMDLGGKRFRPRLLLLATGMCGGRPENALHAALAIEMVHNFTLIHDDIMDDATTRRGHPSVHAKWNETTAILSGDVLFTLAIRKLLEEKRGESITEKKKLTLLSSFLEAVQTVCDGQALDIAFQTREEVTISEYLKMIESKTAALIRCCMEMGALFADAQPKKIELCKTIGTHMGLAFQIQDDLLDATADFSNFGKKKGGDIVEGKKTFLSILALERADKEKKDFLKQLYGNKNAEDDDIEKVIQCYHDLGIIDETASQISSHYEVALKNINEFEESDYLNEIKRLLDKLKNRNK